MQTLSEQIENRQIRLLYKQLPVIVIGSLIAALSFVGLTWKFVSPQGLLIWFFFYLCLSIARGILAWAYWSYDSKHEVSNPSWGILFFVGSGLAGCMWGVTALIFYLPNEPQHILLILVLTTGLVSSCAASSGMCMPAFYSFVIPAMTPYTFVFLTHEKSIFILIGLLTIVYFIGSFIFVRNYHNNSTSLIRTQLENEILLEKIQEEKISAETNQNIAEQAVLEKNRFLASASHDLRQPLHAMGLFIGALRREASVQQFHLIDSIQGSVAALNHLFNSLLDVSRLDAGVVKVAPRHVVLEDLMQRLYIQYKPLAQDHELSLNVSCNNLVVFVDVVLLERVLRNLLVNAINYTNSGRVSIDCQQMDEYIQIQVSDTGIGIPAGETQAIFSEYYQLNNPERDRNKGLGLGLAIVRRLCDLMEVPISVQSNSGRGTTFSLRIKIGMSTQVDKEKVLADSLNITDLSILVIDDEQSVLEGMHNILTGWGCQVIVAESESEAVTAITSQNIVPDIIFSDYRLRDNKTGVDAIEAIFEELNCSIPAVLITGDTSPELLKQAASKGIHMLHKPVTPDTLNQALADWAI